MNTMFIIECIIINKYDYNMINYNKYTLYIHIYN